MGTSNTKRPYEELSDIEKLQKQWHKLSGLHSREEWSSAVVRAATAAEIAANFAVRAEFSAQSTLSPDFVNSMLKWANGLAGKVERLLLPLAKSDKEKHKQLQKLKGISEQINKKRNAVAHQGEFCNEEEAKEAISNARDFITQLVQFYDPSFKLKERKR